MCFYTALEVTLPYYLFALLLLNLPKHTPEHLKCLIFPVLVTTEEYWHTKTYPYGSYGIGPYTQYGIMPLMQVRKR